MFPAKQEPPHPPATTNIELVAVDQRGSTIEPITKKTSQKNEDAEKLIQFCYLQISQAVPTALNNSIYAAHRFLFSPIQIGFETVRSGIGYLEAQRDLDAT